MGIFKGILERPGFIVLMIAIAYGVAFEVLGMGHLPPTLHEQAIYNILEQFSSSPFPPKIGLVRELPDWGHLGYYALWGRAFSLLSGDYYKLRVLELLLTLGSFFLFVRLGLWFIYRNRLSTVYVSLALLLIAVNPMSWEMAFRIDHKALFLIFLFLSMLFFEKENYGKASLALSAALLVDWNALLLGLAFLLSRLFGEKTRLIRPERVLSYLWPFVVAALVFLSWDGFVPQGQARGWFFALVEKKLVFHLPQFFYSVGFLSIYGLGFTWFWAIRARAKALTIGAVWSVLMVPLYFLFPLQPDRWSLIRHEVSLPIGALDWASEWLVGPYKNLLLFLPWLAGSYFFVQLFLMDVLERSKWLRFYIVLFFLAQTTVLGVDMGGSDLWGSVDGQFLMVLPAVLLFTLSEGLVGEQGKLA